MNYGAILNVDIIAEFDAVYIAANNRIKPDAAVLAHYYITNNSTIIC
jgi:hypothetical protein